MKEEIEPHWTTREAKRKEKPRPKYVVPDAEYIKFSSLVYDDAKRLFKQDLADAVAQDTVINARESRDKRWQGVQTLADDIWKKTKSHRPSPILYIHTEKSPFYEGAVQSNRTAAARADAIHVFDDSVLLGAQESPTTRAVIAHEIAHLVNKDMTKEGRHRMLSRQNQEYEEVQAHKRGAILNGNPRQYAEMISAIYWKKCPDRYESKKVTHLSPNRTARLMSGWARILEDEGAADKISGDIIDMKKAMEIYGRSQSMTAFLAKIDGQIEMAKNR